MNDAGTILLADSNPDELLLLEQALREAGFSHKIVALNDGAELLAYLAGERAYADRAAFPLPVLLVAESRLRLHGPVEALQWIKTNPDTGKAITVLILSMVDDPLAKEALLKLGADAFLVKPFGYEDLLAMVRDWRKYLHGA